MSTTTKLPKPGELYRAVAYSGGAHKPSTYDYFLIVTVVERPNEYFYPQDIENSSYIPGFNGPPRQLWDITWLVHEEIYTVEYINLEVFHKKFTKVK